MIIERILRILIDDKAAPPPPWTRDHPLIRNINFARHRIRRAPPTLAEAQAYLSTPRISRPRGTIANLSGRG